MRRSRIRRAACRLRLSSSSSTGTYRTTGRPRGVMVRDSPRATLSRRRAKWVLASDAPTVSIGRPPRKLIYPTSLLMDPPRTHRATHDCVLGTQPRICVGFRPWQNWPDRLFEAKRAIGFRFTRAGHSSASSSHAQGPFGCDRPTTARRRQHNASSRSKLPADS